MEKCLFYSASYIILELMIHWDWENPGKSQEKITFFYSNQRALEQHPWWKLWAT